MDVDDFYKYLGVGSVCRTSKSTVLQTLTSGLLELGHAPLKPQQKVRLLTSHLLPKLSHRLQLGDGVNLKTLKKVDLHVRKALRTWLHLPHDVPNEFFYAKVQDGGIGIMNHSVQIRIARRDRIESLVTRALSSNDPALQWLVGIALHDDGSLMYKERCRLSTVIAHGVR